MNRQLFIPSRNPLARYKGLLLGARWSAKGKDITSVCLRTITLLLLLVGAYSATPKSAAAAVTTIPLGCAASEFGQNIVIPLSNAVPEGATIMVAVQVIARNEDLTGIVDPAGNIYTRLVKHLGFEVGTSVKENYTLHLYGASDAKGLKQGQTITVQWSYANQLEACAIAVNGVTRAPFDRLAENHGAIQATSAALDSRNTLVTTTPSEVLVGAFGWFCVDLEKRIICDATSTPGTGYTEVLEGQDVMLQTRSVPNVGLYNSTATLDKTAASSAAKATFQWNAALMTLRVDSTPPVIASPTIAGTLGTNGWYTSNIVVTWSAIDSESRVTTPPCNTTINTDTASANVSCTATSAGGSSTSPNVTVKRDATPPTITAAVVPAPNASGWNNSDVTVSYTCNDALAGVAGACPAPQVIGVEGTVALPVISDLAGNKSAAGVSARIDKSAPVVTVAGVSNGATYGLGSVPAATCSTSDALSGVATQAAATVTGGASDGLGLFTVTCSGATDRVGNSSQPVTITYSVTPPPTPTPIPPTPTPMPTPENVRTVVGWGYNATGALNLPAGTQAIAAVGGAYHSLTLSADGTVAGWGCGVSNYGQCTIPTGVSGVKAIAATQYSLAVKADGTVAAWGCGATNYGQCDVPMGLTNAISVTGGAAQVLALRADGTVVAWGCRNAAPNRGQCTVPAGLSGVKAVAAGTWHNLVLKNDGTLVAWGNNAYGEGTVPSGLNGVVAISVSGYNNLALKSDGTVVAWGNPAYKSNIVPQGLNGVIAIAAGHYHNMALKSDGTVVAWGCGGTNYGQCTVPTGLSGVTAISAGVAHSLALTRGASAGVAASGAVVAADASAAANEPLTTTPLEELIASTESVLDSGTGAVEAAPVVTESVPVSAPAVITEPVIVDTPAVPVDASAPVVPDASEQNNRLFLPFISNAGDLAGTALGSFNRTTLLTLGFVILVGGVLWLRQRRTRR